MDKKVLLVSYFFPPSGSTGAFRPAKFVKFLRDFDWKPIVLTVKKSFDYGIPEDVSRLKDIPENTRVYRTWSFEPMNWYWTWRTQGKKKETLLKTSNKSDNENTEEGKVSFLTSFKRFIWDVIHLPDRYVGWIPFAFICGLWAIVKHRPHVIMATTPYPSALVVAYWLSFFSGTPLVVDYRDPWTDPYTGKQSHSWMKGIHQWMEKCILKRSKKIIAVTETRLEELLSKYDISRDKGKVITNGYDRADCAVLGNVKSDSESVTFLHPGQLYGEEGVVVFLEALESLLQEGVIVLEKIKVQFLGSRPYNDVFERLQKQGVCEYISRKPKPEALALMQQADGLLLFLSDSSWSRGWIISKIFDFMMFEKPVLAMVPEGETANIVTQCGMGQVLGHEKERIKKALVDMWAQYQQGTLQAQYTQEIKKYDRVQLTQLLAQVLNTVIKEK